MVQYYIEAKDRELLFCGKLTRFRWHKYVPGLHGSAFVLISCAQKTHKVVEVWLHLGPSDSSVPPLHIHALCLSDLHMPVLPAKVLMLLRKVWKASP